MSEFVVHSRKGRTEDRMDSSVPTEKQARDLDYCSPERVLAPVRCYFGGAIPLDPATNPNNPTKAREFYTPTEDGLSRSWQHADGVYVNPPYGKMLEAWLRTIGDEASTDRQLPILALPPASRFEQGYFQEHVLSKSNAICFVRKRLAFIRPTTGEVAKGNPYSSLLVGFNVDEEWFKECFACPSSCGCGGFGRKCPGLGLIVGLYDI